MTPLTPDFRAALADAQPPCLSLYQSTHRHRPQNQQDPIRFGNLVKELEQSLQQKFSSDEVAQLLKPFQALAADAEFWNHTRDGWRSLPRPEFFRFTELSGRSPNSRW